LTTGELYEKWKNGIVNDNSGKADALNGQAAKSTNMNGKEPETKFDE